MSQSPTNTPSPTPSPKSAPSRTTARRRPRLRHLLPVLVVVGVGTFGLLSVALPGRSAAAGTASNPVSGTTTTTGPSTTTSTTTAPGVTTTTALSSSPSSLTSGGEGPGAASAGTNFPKASTAKDPITYSTPKLVPEGATLFQINCSSCHGPDAGGSSVAPNLQGLGAATIDFWISTGRMPLATAGTQATEKPPRFNRQQTLAIVSYVASQGDNYGPGIPSVNTKLANLADGESQFVLNCAACHTITGAGDTLADGAYAPSLHVATATQVAEAIRTGPGNMPRFGQGQLSDQQVADIVAYVTKEIQHPNNAGGLGLGGVGPVAEGFVALLIGVGGMMLVAFWLGERA